MRTPRVYLFALISSLLFCLSLAPITSARPQQEFVRVEDGRFKLGEKDFFFVGSNFYRLALEGRFSGQDYNVIDDKGRVTYPLVDDVFAGYADAGIKVVRLWGFFCQNTNASGSAGSFLLTKQGLAQNPVELDDAAFRRMDYVLDAAGRYGVKIILPLVNFEPEYCGMEWWVENTIGAKDKHLFYTDEKVWQKFTSYVHGILNRRNVYSGLYYKNDPSILSFELANEPHTKDYYECTVSGVTESECRSRGMKNYKVGELVYNWLKRISLYVKSVDPHHLLSHGEEGYLASGDTMDSSCLDRHQWIFNGSKGTDYERNATIPSIDFLTAHVYPDSWNIPINELWWVKRCVIEHRADVAKRNGKPIVLEETGFSERPDSYGQKEYKLDRPYYLSKMFRMSTEAGFAGTMVWQAAPLLRTDRPAEDDDFTFPLRIKNNGRFETTGEGHAMRLQIDCMNQLAPLGLAAQCISVCPKNTRVDSERMGIDFEGNRCFLPDPAAGVPATPFPICDNGSADASGWGWTTHQALCLAHPESALQFPQAGGCSCRAP